MKRDAGSIGWLLLLGQAFFQASVIVVVLASTVIGLGGLGMYVGSDVGSFLANVVILGILMLCRRNTTKLPQPRCRRPLALTGAAWLVLLSWNAIVSSVDTVTGHVFSFTTEGAGATSLPFLLLTVGVFPAVVEEFAFRRVIFGLMRKYGFAVAAGFSSLCFGLMHQNFIQILFAGVMGMILCYVYEQTGKLRYGMLLHFLNNAMSVLLSDWNFYARYGTVAEAVLAICALAICGWLLQRKKISFRKLLGVDSEDEAQTARRGVFVCLTRIPVVIYTLFCLGVAVVSIIVK